jgi:hypothetical protein
VSNIGRYELKRTGSGQSVVSLEAGASSSFILPAMHSLGQLRQLLLEVDTSGKQVGGRAPLQHLVSSTFTAQSCMKCSMQFDHKCVMQDV